MTPLGWRGRKILTQTKLSGERVNNHFSSSTVTVVFRSYGPNRWIAGSVLVFADSAVFYRKCFDICWFSSSIFFSFLLLQHCLNSFNPEFLTWTLPSLNLDTFNVANRVSVKNQKQSGKQCRSRWEGSSEWQTVLRRPSHLNLRCLQRYRYWSAGMKWLNKIDGQILFPYCNGTIPKVVSDAILRVSIESENPSVPQLSNHPADIPCENSVYPIVWQNHWG